MAKTRANWHFETLVEESESSFAVAIEEVGTPIDLTQDTASLQRELRLLLKSEGVLFDGGVTCPIKDCEGTVCSICPLSKRGTNDPMAPLCHIGQHQERVLTELAIARQAA